MKIIGLAGAIALVCAAATPAFAQGTTSRPSPGNQPPSSANTPPPATQAPPTVMTPPEAMQPGTPLPQPTAREVARDVGGYMARPVNAPNQAFEMSVDAGYSQGFGNIQSGRGVGTAAGAGGTLGLTLGYRIDPRWSVAASGQYAGFGAGSATPNRTSVRGATAGIQGTYHASPYSRMDPFFTLGTGYRALIESPAGTAPNTVTHGFELAKVEVGLDVRPNDSIAIAPVIGADVNMFAWRSGGGTETAAITGKGVSTFVFAGVKGRFDLGGTREPAPAAQVGRR